MVLFLTLMFLTQRTPEVVLPTSFANHFGHKLYIMYHVCPVSIWESVVTEQLDHIVSSGLYDKIESLWICTSEPQEPVNAKLLVSEFLDVNYSNLSKIKLLYSSDTLTYENTTMNVLREKSKELVLNETDAFILYLHNKASWHKNAQGQVWRKNMMHYVVSNWNACASLLDEGYKTVGPFYHYWARYYTGNFWWARASYLSNLDLIKSFKDRFLAEEFLLNNKPIHSKQHANLKGISMFDHIVFKFHQGALCTPIYEMKDQIKN